MPKTPTPHLLETTDPDRHNPHIPRSCNRCGLPESRTDIHTLPATPADVMAVEARRLGESEETDAHRQN